MVVEVLVAHVLRLGVSVFLVLESGGEHIKYRQTRSVATCQLSLKWAT